MGAGDEEAQARRFLRNGRVQNGLHVDALLEQLRRQARRLQRAAHDGRHDGQARAGAGVDAGGLGAFQEIPAARLQGLYPLRLFQHALERGQRGRRHWRRHAYAVQKAGREELQVFDQGAFSGNVAAAAGQRFAQRAHPDVHVAAIQAEVFADAQAGGAHHAQ